MIQNTYDPKLESCKISTTHTAKLAIQERDRNHNTFMGHITMPPFIASSTEGSLQGVTITNKNCFWKRPEAYEGTWVSQFSPYEGQVEFNVQTKRKTFHTTF